MTAPSTPLSTRDAQAIAGWLARSDKFIDQLKATPPEQRRVTDQILIDQHAAGANAAERAALAGYAERFWSWGQKFVNSPVWINHRGGVTTGAAEIPHYLESRETIVAADVVGAGGLAASAPDPLVAPLAASCTQVTADATPTILRWTGSMTAAAVAEGELKPASDAAPSISTIVLPTVATWLPVTRQAMEDLGAVATTIDTRLRRALGVAVDAAVVAAIADDPDAATVTAPTLPAAIANGVGQLGANGFVGSISVLVNPADFGQLGDPRAWLLDPGSLHAAPTVPTGTAYVADLRGVWFLTRGPARIMTTDSHADYFLKNELVLLAEQRAAAAVSEPAAIVKASTEQP